MGIYIALISFAVIFTFLSLSKRVTESNFKHVLGFFGVLFVIVLALVYIFRGNTVGTDYSMYNMFLSQPISYLKGVGIESGYVKLYEIAEAKQWPLFVTITSFIITNVGLYIFAKKNRISTILFSNMMVLTYLYFIMFNIVRQMTAVGICFGALALFLDDSPISGKKFWFKYIVFAVFVLIASKFHASAIIALPMPFMKLFKLNSKWSWAGLVLVTLGFVFDLGNKIVPTLITLFPHYLAKYEYSTNTFFSTGSKGLIAYIPVLVQFIILVLITKYDSEFIEKNRLISSIYFIYLLLFIAAGNQAATRFQIYWMPAVVYFFALYIQNGQNSIGRFSANALKVVIVLFFLIYTILRIATNNSGVFPYYFR